MGNNLLLYSHCIISKGAERASILDLQRNSIHLIPLSLANLFENGRYFNLNKIAKKLSNDEREVLDEYVSFLQKQELVYLMKDEELTRFPRMEEEWLFPAHISNCVLDSNTTMDYFNSSLLHQFEKIGCNFIQFRFYTHTSFDYLQRLMEHINPSQIKSIEIILPQLNEDNFYDAAIAFTKDNRKISNLIIWGAEENGIFQEGLYGMGFITKVSSELDNETHCGIIDPSLFSINIPTYTESLVHNTCLNRKISIDVDGNIKNCPSMKESFGNIKDTTLEEAINQPGFKKYWNIAKDEITKCKDCEFRNICTDCRAYIENPEDMYSTPLKCGYNPYTCEWEDWSTNPLKQQAIEYYGINGFLEKQKP